MSVLVIQGPHAAGSAAASALLPAAVREEFRRAGSAIVVRACASARGLAERLREARGGDVELVLIDAGELDDADCAREAATLRGALDALPVPYIEVHEDRAGELEPRVHPLHAALAVVVMRRDLAGGYALSLAIAMRRLLRLRAAAAVAPRPPAARAA